MVNQQPTHQKKIKEAFDAILSKIPGVLPERKQVWEMVLSMYPETNSNAFGTQWQEFRKNNKEIFPLPVSTLHHSFSNLELNLPSKNEIQKYVDYWQTSKNMLHYRDQEEYIQKLFEERSPKNDDINTIITKVCVLNVFYSTNLNSPIQVAKHIFNIENLDTKIKNGEKSLVDELAIGGDVIVALKNYGTLRNCLSFATKYCRLHNSSPNFRIYDSEVRESLLYFNSMNGFYNKSMSTNQLKTKMEGDYSTYFDILDKFIDTYGLDEYSWELDKYLWLLGKLVLAHKMPPL